MQNSPLRIGTRDSQLAMWQANLVKKLLEKNGYAAELVLIKSQGDMDLVTPLYAMGVQGIFTRSLDTALLNNKIDIAVHSMKDVPVQLPQGIDQAAVVARASHKDILVFNEDVGRADFYFTPSDMSLTIATSSTRRRAQWLNRFPNTQVENLRGNVNTRLKKLTENKWHGAIFAAAGLERIGVRPANSIDLDWMLPAPAQGAIMVVARTDDARSLAACSTFNDADTALCVRVERDFLSALLGGCSTPVGALAIIKNNNIVFKGNIVAPDGSEMVAVEKAFTADQVDIAGAMAAEELLSKGGLSIMKKIKDEQ